GATRDYQVPFESGQIWPAKDRVFLLDADKLVTLEFSDGAVQILASTRRRPPVHELDRGEGMGVSGFLARDDGVACVIAGAKGIFTFDEKTRSLSNTKIDFKVIYPPAGGQYNRWRDIGEYSLFYEERLRDSEIFALT